MRTSERIKCLLDMLGTAQLDYDTAREQISEADRRIQDILHWLEFHEIPPVDGDGAMLVLGVIGMARRDRRAAKDTEAVTRPVAEWADSHKSTINSLEQLLGGVRKAERGIENRHYIDRTDIMEEMLGEESV
ncbi:MAG: hypothetical protein HFH54_01565 [Lachnospiraceae bacterium]|nr:hypothetical protein [Lachnospiraceae bacterium]